MNQINLIILPGWGGSHETWQNFVARVSKNFDSVHVIDLPCFGGVPCPTEVWGVDEYVNYVNTKIKELNLSGEKVLLGHSFGGQVAASLVADYNGLVDKLVLSGAAIIRPKHKIRRLLFGGFAKVGKAFFKLPVMEKFDATAKKVLYKAVGAGDYNETSGIKREIFKKIIRENKAEVLSKIKVPTLILWGENDKYVPLKYGKEIHKMIPGAAMHIVKDGGHGLHINNIEEIELILKEFLSHD